MDLWIRRVEQHEALADDAMIKLREKYRRRMYVSAQMKQCGWINTVTAV
jgi:hypothetical protein